LTVFSRYDTHTAQEPDSLFRYHAVMLITFTDVNNWE